MGVSAGRSAVPVRNAGSHAPSWMGSSGPPSRGGRTRASTPTSTTFHPPGSAAPGRLRRRAGRGGVWAPGMSSRSAGGRGDWTVEAEREAPAHRLGLSRSHRSQGSGRRSRGAARDRAVAHPLVPARSIVPKARLACDWLGRYEKGEPPPSPDPRSGDPRRTGNSLGPGRRVCAPGPAWGADCGAERAVSEAIRDVVRREAATNPATPSQAAVIEAMVRAHLMH